MAAFISRKFLFSVGTVLLTSVLVFLEKIDSATYGLIVIAVVGAYLAANVAQKKVEQ